MDTYQKVLVKLFEVTGGKESVDVDFADLVKSEGYFPSLDDIKDRFSRESWITETSTLNVVRITHWGVSAAKKAGKQRPDGVRAVEREANRLLAESREFGVVIEEFRAEPTSARFKAVETKLAELREIAAKVKDLV